MPTKIVDPELGPADTTPSLSRKTNAIADQIKVSIISAVRQVVGSENITIKILSSSVEVSPLSPTGERLDIKLSLDVYPKT